MRAIQDLEALCEAEREAVEERERLEREAATQRNRDLDRKLAELEAEYATVRDSLGPALQVCPQQPVQCRVHTPC